MWFLWKKFQKFDCLLDFRQVMQNFFDTINYYYFFKNDNRGSTTDIFFINNQ